MEMLLDGEWVDRDSRFEVHDPQDGSLLDAVPLASEDDMRAAIDAAVVGATRARAMPVHERMAILHRAADLIDKDLEGYATTIAREGIKTIREARKEAGRAVHTMRLSAEACRRVTGETVAFDQYPGGDNRVGYWIPEPLGIVAAITPYNDPLNLVAHKVGPGLAAGNAVIVKPDSKTPLSALKLARAIHDAGMPAGVLQCLSGPGKVIGDVLVTDPRVRMVSFTGGLEVGRIIAARAGLKKLGMELGSNSPVIVMGDADLDAALEAVVSGAFWAAGQNCLHVQRLLLHDDIYDHFSARFAAAAAAYVVGDKLDEATDMGPLINEDAAQEVERLVDDAVSGGASLLTGGTRNGAFYDPTVLADVPDDCVLAREEVYGPVTLLYRFADLDEAVRRANEVDYGLHAAIFTRDIDSALRAAEQLECGGVMINESTDYRMDAMPFGGVKGSGLGREGIEFAIREMTEPKTVCFTRHR
ncbi:MAG: aldehyde dehydrogenase family protein [Acidobacteriota bacterium]|jgi:glyceraldehyde-3-phosphate dehydrogenase (NADP+)